MKRALALLSLVLLLCTFSLGQSVEVSKTNKTIAVTADDSVSVDPDVAIISFGYKNFGLTKDEAYGENLKVSEAIVKAMFDAGVPSAAIETGTLTLERPETEEKWTAEQKKQRQFSAEQSWKAKIPAKEAQKLVDVIMHAGANDLGPVNWDYSDRPSLQAQAGGAALAKARQIAEQMAKGLGAKLGELVYASNQAPEVTTMQFWRRGVANVTLNTASASLDAKQPSLLLFPQKVKQTATVHAVFAIE